MNWRAAFMENSNGFAAIPVKIKILEAKTVVQQRDRRQSWALQKETKALLRMCSQT
jgi:hypothetical protein